MDFPSDELCRTALALKLKNLDEQQREIALQRAKDGRYPEHEWLKVAILTCIEKHLPTNKKYRLWVSSWLCSAGFPLRKRLAYQLMTIRKKHGNHDAMEFRKCLLWGGVYPFKIPSVNSQPTNCKERSDMLYARLVRAASRFRYPRDEKKADNLLARWRVWEQRTLKAFISFGVMGWKDYEPDSPTPKEIGDVLE